MRHYKNDMTLESSLERELDRLGLPLENLPEVEEMLLREFRRNFFRYSQYQPWDIDRTEWIAYMQHHGTPTRFLDWTYSFYVALFFALDKVRVNTKSAIWAVDHDACWTIVVDKLPKVIPKLEDNDKDSEALDMVLSSNEELVCPLNAFCLNERLAVQQGIFLAPCAPKIEFQQCFDSTFATCPDKWKKIEIECSKEFLQKSLSELQRMNVGATSLFPGLDGFCRGISEKIPLKKLWYEQIF